MPENEHKPWIWDSGFVVNLVCNLISLAVGILVTYLTHEGSQWVKPLLFGGGAWMLSFGSIMAVRWSRRMPTKLEPMSTKNIQKRIRDWLDKYNLTVQSLSDDTGYFFFFIVTTEGGKKISVLRSKGKFSEYVEVRGFISASEEELNALSTFSVEEITAARLAINLELSRSVMGYKTEKNVLEEVTVFKRIPIVPALHEEDIFNLMWEIEAMLGTIFTVGAMAILRNRVNLEKQSETL